MRDFRALQRGGLYSDRSGERLAFEDREAAREARRQATQAHLRGDRTLQLL